MRRTARFISFMIAGGHSGPSLSPISSNRRETSMYSEQ